MRDAVRNKKGWRRCRTPTQDPSTDSHLQVHVEAERRHEHQLEQDDLQRVRQRQRMTADQQDAPPHLEGRVPGAQEKSEAAGGTRACEGVVLVQTNMAESKFI